MIPSPSPLIVNPIPGEKISSLAHQTPGRKSSSHVWTMEQAGSAGVQACRIQELRLVSAVCPLLLCQLWVASFSFALWCHPLGKDKRFHIQWALLIFEIACCQLVGGHGPKKADLAWKEVPVRSFFLILSSLCFSLFYFIFFKSVAAPLNHKCTITKFCLIKGFSKNGTLHPDCFQLHPHLMWIKSTLFCWTPPWYQLSKKPTRAWLNMTMKGLSGGTHAPSLSGASIHCQRTWEPCWQECPSGSVE